MPLCNTDRIIKDEDVITKHFTTAQVICSCSGILLSVIVTCLLAVPIGMALYDGKDSTGKVLFSITTTLSRSYPYIPDEPIHFGKGLYLYLSPFHICTVQYIPDY